MKNLWDTKRQLFLKDCENWIFKFWNLWNCISGLRLAASMSPDVSKSPSRMSRSRSLRRTAWHRLQPPTRDPTQCYTTTCFPHHPVTPAERLGFAAKGLWPPCQCVYWLSGKRSELLPISSHKFMKRWGLGKIWKWSRDSRTEWSWVVENKNILKQIEIKVLAF